MLECQRCDWSGDTDDAAAEHAHDSGHRRCIVCRWHFLTVTERQTCLDCLAASRTYLDEILELYGLLPEETFVHANAAIPGGDALVMLAGGNVSVGSNDHAKRLRSKKWEVEKVEWSGCGDDAVLSVEGETLVYTESLPRWLDEPVGLFDTESDPESVSASLGSWVDDWVSYLHHPAATGAASALLCVDYLKRHHTWAAQHHPAFDEYERDLRRILGRLRQATAHSDDPEQGPPCLYCGSRLVRGYAPPRPCPHGQHPAHQARWDERERAWVGGCEQGGLSESWACPRCRREYGEADFRLAIRSAHAADAGWVPINVAADVVGRSVNTVRSWMRELRVSAMCPLRWRDGKPVRVPPLVRWADVHDLAVKAGKRAA